MAGKEEKLTLIQKLAKIRGIADVVSKDKRGYNYSYSDINEILAKIKAGMDKYGVSLQPIIENNSASVEQLITVTTKRSHDGSVFDEKKNEMLVTAPITFRWIDDEDEEKQTHIDIPWFLVGSQSDPSQAFGSALTYCTRYFLLNFFQIAQDNDVDAYRSKQQEAAEKEDRETAAEIIAIIDKEIREYLANNNGKSVAVKKLCERFVKDGKYKTIKEPAIAGKLLDAFRSEFANASSKAEEKTETVSTETEKENKEEK